MQQESLGKNTDPAWHSRQSQPRGCSCCSLSSHSSEVLHTVILTEHDSNLTFTSPLRTGLSSKPMTTVSLSESKKIWITEWNITFMIRYYRESRDKFMTIPIQLLIHGIWIQHQCWNNRQQFKLLRWAIAFNWLLGKSFAILPLLFLWFRKA